MNRPDEHGRPLGAIATPLLRARAIEAQAEALFGRLDFLATVAEEPLVLVGRAGVVADLEALRALGPQATLGTPPKGSAAQFAALALAGALPFNLLSFASVSAARQTVLAGNIPCALLTLPEAITALREGKLAGLALAADRRSRSLPDVPTFPEQGIGLRLTAHRGFAVPAGTDPALLAALRAAVADPEFAAQAQGMSSASSAHRPGSRCCAGPWPGWAVAG